MKKNGNTEKGRAGTAFKSQKNIKLLSPRSGKSIGGVEHAFFKI